MNSARFVAPARRELLSEVAYYQVMEEGLGSKFLAALEEATIRALAYPMTGSPAPSRTRRVFLKDFPFAIIYRPDDQGITVYAIAHHARRPNYWLSRTNDR